MVHRPVRLGKVHAGRPPSRSDWCSTAATPTGSTGTTSAPGSTGTSGSPGADRQENARRVAEVACLFADAGLVAIVALISPYAESRPWARQIHDGAGLPFVEVYMAAPADLCANRDPKGLYAQASSGSISSFTGVDDPYEVPDSPDLVIEPAYLGRRGRRRGGGHPRPHRRSRVPAPGIRRLSPSASIVRRHRPLRVAAPFLTAVGQAKSQADVYDDSGGVGPKRVGPALY